MNTQPRTPVSASPDLLAPAFGAQGVAEAGARVVASCAQCCIVSLATTIAPHESSGRCVSSQMDTRSARVKTALLVALALARIVPAQPPTAVAEWCSVAGNSNSNACNCLVGAGLQHPQRMAAGRAALQPGACVDRPPHAACTLTHSMRTPAERHLPAEPHDHLPGVLHAQGCQDRVDRVCQPAVSSLPRATHLRVPLCPSSWRR
jgi:hypothetical protein